MCGKPQMFTEEDQIPIEVTVMSDLHFNRVVLPAIWVHVDRRIDRLRRTE
jgi:hypothetical protein